MRRRNLLKLTGGTACGSLVWSPQLAAQPRAMSVIGFLHGGAAGPFEPFAAAFREGLGEAGFVEGRNLTIEYRWAEGEPDRLPALAADLVGRKVDLIAALKASDDYCDGVYSAMTDSDGMAIVKSPLGSRSKLGMLNFNVSHDNEMYGTIAVYLRLKGLIPPSTEGAAAARPK